MQAFRDGTPARTCSKTFSNYRDFKPYLREDFKMRCGYCHDRDLACGGRWGMHIDHFRPKALFMHLATHYSNLVYACPYCNLAKSDDWPGNETQCVVGDRGYIDPCSPALDQHFERYDNGRIRPKTLVGKYMFRRLRLGLRRHQLAWVCEQLEKLLQELVHELSKLSPQHPDEQQFLNQQTSLVREYLKYKKLFEETL